MRGLIYLGISLAGMWMERRAAAAEVDYVRDVKPLLKEKCSACHGPVKQKAGLRLDAAALVRQGGESGLVVEPDNPDTSLLIERVTADETDRMPPASEGEALTEREIALLKAWIKSGAPGPADEEVLPAPKDHWAFKTPRRPAVPNVSRAVGVFNPIDAFIAQKYERYNLSPVEPADKAVWLRRVYLDLIGIPPTPDERRAYLADNSPDADENVVDRLLESPHYGERWGRHWMDIWRYSDWWGLKDEVRNSHRHMWHWRDWIVESVNADKGYDQMLREMLAADELYPNDLDRLRATGYLARSYYLFNRTTWLDGTLEHIGKGMLGLTFNCAKCHDHKYDPLTQLEYYQLRALFEPHHVRMEMVPGESDFDKAGIPRAYDAHLDAETFVHVRGDDRNPDKSRAIQPAVPAFLTANGFELAIKPVELPLEARHPGLRPFVIEAYRKSIKRSIAQAHREVAAALEKLADTEGATSQQLAATATLPKVNPRDVEFVASGAKDQDLGAATADTAQTLDYARLACALAEKALTRAEAHLAAIEAQAAADQAHFLFPDGRHLKTLGTAATQAERGLTIARAEEALCRAELALLEAAADKKGAAERSLAAAKTALEKAREKADETYTPLVGAAKAKESFLDPNPIKPFPATSSGRRTAFVTWLTDQQHPLTARVAVNHTWVRHMGQPLVPSVFDFGLNGKPPTHPELLDWLAVELVEHGWSMKHIHRLITTSRTYRLSSSSAAAEPATRAADPDNCFFWRMNFVRMEAEIIRDSLLHLAGELDISIGGPSVPIGDSNRRSIYFVHSYNDRETFLSMFDSANVIECYRRDNSIVPQQALALENSPFIAEMAKQIATRIAAVNPFASDQEFVRAAFVTVLSIEPTVSEQKLVAEMLSRLASAARTKNRPYPELQARIAVVQALLNHNDFVTIR